MKTVCLLFGEKASYIYDNFDYGYDSSTKMWEQIYKFATLKRAKDYVNEQRNENSLSCKLYIESGSRVWKRYDEVELPKL